MRVRNRGGATVDSFLLKSSSEARAQLGSPARKIVGSRFPGSDLIFKHQLQLDHGGFDLSIESIQRPSVVVVQLRHATFGLVP